MDKTEMDCNWVILKNVAPTFFKFMANHQDKGRFCSKSSCLRGNDHFSSKGISHYLFLVLNSKGSWDRVFQRVIKVVNYPKQEELARRDSAVVRALASHQCGPDSASYVG